MDSDASVLTNLLHRERLCREGEPKGDGRCFQWNGQHHHTDIPQGKQRHLVLCPVEWPLSKTIIPQGKQRHLAASFLTEQPYSGTNLLTPRQGRGLEKVH